MLGNQFIENLKLLKKSSNKIVYLTIYSVSYQIPDYVSLLQFKIK